MTRPAGYRRSLLTFVALLAGVLVVGVALDGCAGDPRLDPRLESRQELRQEPDSPGDRSREVQEPAFEYAVSLNPYELTGPEMRGALDLAQNAGVNSVVAGAVWWYVAPRQNTGNYRLRPMDALLKETRRRGMKLSIQITGTPDWVHPELRTVVRADSRRIWYPPRGADEIRFFSDFVGFLVDRYGTRVERYEIWNEPNSLDFWEPAPDAAEYAALLRSAYLRAKAVDPEVTVAFGGLSMNDVGFLEKYYEAARAYPDARQSDHFFDVLTVHPYTYGQSPDWKGAGRRMAGPNGPLDQSFTGLSEMKSSMERNQDGAKKIFVGEFGYPTASTSDTWMEPVPERRRALYLKRAYILARQMPYVVGMSWYSYVPDSAVGPEWTILDRDLTPSTTYRALKQVTGAAPSDAEVILPPQQNPVSGFYLAEPLLAGIGVEDVYRWELYANGELLQTSEQAPFAWDTRTVENGDHSLMLAAYTRAGDVWSSKPVSLSVENP